MTDPLADMFSQIQNAQGALKETAEVPFSKLKLEIAKILEKEGLIRSAEIKGRKVKKTIELLLRYENKVPAISAIKRISKPGQRIYAPSLHIQRPRGGAGIVLVSTSKGILTDREARKQRIGGEVLCEVYS